MLDQMPFTDVEFVDNPEPRCPCVILLDASGSMQGRPIQLLNEAMELFAQELNNDRLASKRVEVAVVTFGQAVHTVQEFVNPTAFLPPRLEADGSTPMGEAVVQACGLLEERKQVYRSAGISYFRPWVILLTDGAATDYHTHYWNSAVDLVREGEASKKLLFFGIAVQDADKSKLDELCPPNRPAMKLKGLSFRELFTWLSSSLRTVSSANPGASGLTLPPTSGWASVDI